ncbi:MAG: transglutaminase-like domain-containing protein [Thermoguttaceae bacterium]|jgi:hypothetical protein
MFTRFLPIVALLLASGAASRLQGTEETTYYTILTDGKNVGHITATEKIGPVVETATTVELSTEKGKSTVFQREVETPDGKPLSLEKIDSDDDLKIEGKILPNGKLRIRRSAAGAAKEFTMAWPAGAVLGHGTSLLLVRMGLKEGTRYAYTTFDVDSRKFMKCDVTVGRTGPVAVLGKNMVLTETRYARDDGLTVTDYQDREGHSWKSCFQLFGSTTQIIRCDREQAMAKEQPFVVDLKPLPCPKRMDATGAISVTYELTPKKGRTIGTIPTTGAQSVRRHADGSATVVVSMRPMIATRQKAQITCPIGYHGSDPAVLEALKPTKYIESDAAEVKRLARKALGARTNAVEAVFAIQGFVYDYITDKREKTEQLEATGIIRAKSGNCKHHAILAAALLRASGIPARLASGLVYCPETSGFSGHAWTEAYVDGKWIDIDSTYCASNGFDAGHICLDTTNELLDGFGLAGTWGCFDIAGVAVEAGGPGARVGGAQDYEAAGVTGGCASNPPAGGAQGIWYPAAAPPDSGVYCPQHRVRWLRCGGRRKALRPACHMLPGAS